MSHKTYSVFCWIFLLLEALAMSALAAETSQVIPFSNCDSRLSGSVSLRFRLFTARTGGAQVFEETQSQISVDTQGCFSALIGDVTLGGITPFSIFADNRSLWIAFALEENPDAELGGDRTPIPAAGYAFKAINADQANQATTAQTASSAQIAATLTPGASSSGSLAGPILTLNNTTGAGLTAAGSDTGVRGEATSTALNAAGVIGRVTSTAPGASSAGVRGINEGTGDTGFGVWGSHNGSGLGVYGTSVSGRGVVGLHSGAAGTEPGVLGETNSTASNAAGVIGRVAPIMADSGAFSAGVLGINQGGGNNGYGVWGLHNGVRGVGVHGQSNRGVGVLGTVQGFGIGVWGDSFEEAVRGTSVDGVGVRGVSEFYIGVAGETNFTGYPGIMARSVRGLATELGLQVQGTLQATGTKSAAVPASNGQHMLLYSEESTEVWFSDYGSVQLVNGVAVVQIDPEFLQTVNTNKKYHVFLTATGNPRGTLYIDNRTPSSFEVRETTSTANIEVSYRIVAKRKDFTEERMKKVILPEWKDWNGSKIR